MEKSFSHKSLKRGETQIHQPIGRVQTSTYTNKQLSSHALILLQTNTHIHIGIRTANWPTVASTPLSATVQ